jgi:hypothetical protein
LLSGVPTSAFHDAAQLGWLLKLIPDKADERKPDSPLVAALVRLANGLLESPLPADENVRDLRKDFFKRLPTGVLVQLPLDSAEADLAIKHALPARDLPVALLWQDWCDVSGSGKLPWSSLQPLLQALGGLDLNDDKAIKQRSAIAVRLLGRLPAQPGARLAALFAWLPLFAVHPDWRMARPGRLTCAELQAAAHLRPTVFTSGQIVAADLAKAAHRTSKPLVIGKATFAQSAAVARRPPAMQTPVHRLLQVGQPACASTLPAASRSVRAVCCGETALLRTDERPLGSALPVAWAGRPVVQCRRPSLGDMPRAASSPSWRVSRWMPPAKRWRLVPRETARTVGPERRTAAGAAVARDFGGLH